MGETIVLKDISFEVSPGEFIAIVGPSGCGKSTLLSIIAGLIIPDQGNVLFKSAHHNFKLPGIGYMFQKDNLFEWKTIYKNIILGLEINHICNEDNLSFVNGLIDQYGLRDFVNKRPSELSGGMRQRAALIRTLALKPEILLLDEPFSALDYQNRMLVSKDICDIIKRSNKTMILVTHDLQEAITLADKIIILSQRPSHIKKIVNIDIDKNRDILSIRSDNKFQDYLNILWKEMLESETNE